MSKPLEGKSLRYPIVPVGLISEECESQLSWMVSACLDIEARPDMQLESDLKLDRLETFLRRLNNKGTYQKLEGRFGFHA